MKLLVYVDKAVTPMHHCSHIAAKSGQKFSLFVEVNLFYLNILANTHFYIIIKLIKMRFIFLKNTLYIHAYIYRDK